MRKFIKNIVVLINLAFASALLISYLSVRINPAVFVFPAYFGLAYPYLLMVNILFGLFWLIRMSPEFLISALTIFIGVTHLQNTIRVTGSKADSSGKSFNIISYNLRLFNLMEGSSTVASEKGILEFLKSEAPSVVSLQEYFVQGSTDMKIAELRKQFGKGTYTHQKFIRGRDGRNYGNIIISKFPVVKRGEINFPGSSSIAIYADLKVGKDTVRFYNIHLQSFRLRRIENSFLEEMTLVEQDQFYSEITNLHATLKKGFVKRAEQSRILMAHIAGSPYPVIVAGDFNDTPVSYTYHNLRHNLNDTFVDTGRGLGYTYRGKYPPNRIDYILYSGKLKNSGFTILREKFSDHLPIKASFTRAD